MNQANVPEQADVVVVGAGMAGLIAARDLLDANVSALVLRVPTPTRSLGAATESAAQSLLS
jgi:monoamine oxidase